MKRALVLGSALAVMAAAPAAAQTEFGIDASVYSAYIWRGVTLTSKPVLQPDFWLSFPIGSASLTVGAWGNVDLGEYSDPEDVAQSGGSGLDLSEVDPYVEVGFSAAKASIALGGVAYVYPNDAPAIDSDFNTVELYGRVELDVPFGPSLAVYYDVDKVKGLYIEGGLSRSFPLGAAELTFGAIGGYNAGQGINSDDPNEVANFDDDGFTHADLSASVSFSAGPLSIAPALHFQINGDEFTKYTNFDPDNADEDFKIWGGVTISWSKLFGGEAEE